MLVLYVFIDGAPGRNRTHALALQERTSTIKDTRALERVAGIEPVLSSLEN